MSKDDFVNIVSVSGGKDSTAMYCWAIDQFGKDGFYPIFVDVGHEHPVTVNYIKNLHFLTGGNPVEIRKADLSDRLKKKFGSLANNDKWRLYSNKRTYPYKENRIKKPF